jgi:hypothetical protein
LTACIDAASGVNSGANVPSSAMANYINSKSHLPNTAGALGDGGEVLKPDRATDVCSVCGALADVGIYAHTGVAVFYCAKNVPG